MTDSPPPNEPLRFEVAKTREGLGWLHAARTVDAAVRLYPELVSTNCWYDGVAWDTGPTAPTGRLLSRC
jgi:hypothetical protein